MSGATHLNILGTRGVPAAHGGFETFAERLALYLVQRGYSVTVYCQSDRGQDLTPREDMWRGIHRVHIGTRRGGVLGTMEFDLASVRHVLPQPGVDLVLGYNTAVFNLLQCLRRRRIYMNMDGIEWRREKWSLPAKAWLMMNEFIGANLCKRPIADHPEIGHHIARRSRRRPVVIPYGADVVGAAGDHAPRRLGLEPGGYFISIARIEPENSVLEIIRAFTAARTGMKLAVLGRLDPSIGYHRRVMDAADGSVVFPGGIYEDEAVKSLRFHARAYFHGHQVGGTNPSLVEALGAGNAVIAHDNRFNRWTAGPEQHFFGCEKSCTAHVRELAFNDLANFRARIAARERHAQQFRWNDVLGQYEALMLDRAAVQIAAE